MSNLNRFQHYFAIICAAVLFAFFAAVAPVFAEEGEPDQYVTVEMRAAVDAVVPGETFLIGFQQKIYPGWHTYWINPGDTGAETRIDLDMPEGFAAGEILWPLPERQPYEDMFVNFGYSGTAYFLMEITAPEQIAAETVTIAADKHWLVCEEICIPEDGRYSLTLPVRESVNPAHEDFFAAAQAQQPAVKDWAARFAVSGGTATLEIPADITLAEGDSVSFFPAEWGIIDNLAAQTARVENGQLILHVKAGDRDLDEIAATEALLRIDRAGGETEGYAFTAVKSDTPLAAAPADKGRAVAGGGFLLHLLFALIGGMILNLMPCVFPVLSLKALSLVKHGGGPKAVMHGISYTGGVIGTFAVVAGALLVLQAFGSGAGWGFQLQNPYVILFLAYLMYLIGLNLSGFYEISISVGSAGSSAARDEGYKGSFFTGILATVLATPCTAPFMAAAIGYALVQPPVQAMSIFLVMGLGLALPYLALSIFPQLQKALPKPGVWMVRFRQFLAFPMYLTAVWLIWVLGQQAGIDAVFAALAGFVAVAWMFWLKDAKRNIWSRGFMILLAVCLAFSIVKMPVPRDSAIAVEEFAFSQATVDRLLAESDDPVFVNMTAAWCITCKANERVALFTETGRALFAENNIVLVTGDWTRYDENITAYLEKYQRRGVPLYVYYGPRDTETGTRPAPYVLPQLLTPQILRNAVEGQSQ
ncbi:MAG: hypothetical protein EA357_01295 [Micavibrio sp.]|nr:MAG: hypothetical protein EA357_01295 [Micavibrio sp.]